MMMSLLKDLSEIGTAINNDLKVHSLYLTIPSFVKPLSGYGVSSLPELEITGNWNCLFKKKWNWNLSLLQKKIHKLIYHLIFLIQKYFFNDNPTWNINYSE